MKKYAWKNGAVVAVDAEEAAQQFGAIFEEYGVLLPEVVVEQSDQKMHRCMMPSNGTTRWRRINTAMIRQDT